LGGFVMVLMAAVCLGIAAQTEILTLTLGGVAGTAEDLPFADAPTGMGSAKHFYLYDIPLQLIKSTDTDFVPGAKVLAATYILFVGVGPAAFLVCVFCLWVSAFVLTVRRSRGAPAWVAATFRVSKAMLPYCFSWVATDVVLVTAVCAILEMDLTVQWIVQEQVGPLCDLLRSHLNQECIEIDGALRAGWVWLLVATLLCGNVFIFTSRTFGLAVLGRKPRGKNGKR
jgi:hypothetical protein